MTRKLSSGCILCHEGAKMVLFITGVCNRSCWYCPLSSERKGKDLTFANERRISLPDEAVAQAHLMSALGTGITGGEPLTRLDRVLDYARSLKEEFGDSHHIHLYTASAATKPELLAMSGLIDEIRMHPPREEWDSILDSAFLVSAETAKNLGFSTGFEVPSLPGIEQLDKALRYIDFLNINELEWGESNAAEMRRRGLQPKEEAGNAVKGGESGAAELLLHRKVHWCSSGFKDSVQLRKRLQRIARNTARTFDEVTEDGTIIYGLIEQAGGIPPMLRDLGDEMYESVEGKIETAWWILMEHKEKINGRKVIIERYPDRGMIVEVTPV